MIFLLLPVDSDHIRLKFGGKKTWNVIAHKVRISLRDVILSLSLAFSCARSPTLNYSHFWPFPTWHLHLDTVCREIQGLKAAQRDLHEKQEMLKDQKVNEAGQEGFFVSKIEL